MNTHNLASCLCVLLFTNVQSFGLARRVNLGVVPFDVEDINSGVQITVVPFSWMISHAELYIKNEKGEYVEGVEKSNKLMKIFENSLPVVFREVGGFIYETVEQTMTIDLAPDEGLTVLPAVVDTLEPVVIRAAANSDRMRFYQTTRKKSTLIKFGVQNVDTTLSGNHIAIKCSDHFQNIEPNIRLVHSIHTYWIKRAGWHRCRVLQSSMHHQWFTPFEAGGNQIKSMRVQKTSNQSPEFIPTVPCTPRIGTQHRHDPSAQEPQSIDTRYLPKHDGAHNNLCGSCLATMATMATMTEIMNMLCNYHHDHVNRYHRHPQLPVCPCRGQCRCSKQYQRYPDAPQRIPNNNNEDIFSDTESIEPQRQLSSYTQQYNTIPRPPQGTYSRSPTNARELQPTRTSNFSNSARGCPPAVASASTSARGCPPAVASASNSARGCPPAAASASTSARGCPPAAALVRDHRLRSSRRNSPPAPAVAVENVNTRSRVPAVLTSSGGDRPVLNTELSMESNSGDIYSDGE